MKNKEYEEWFNEAKKKDLAIELLIRLFNEHHAERYKHKVYDTFGRKKGTAVSLVPNPNIGEKNAKILLERVYVAGQAKGKKIPIVDEAIPYIIAKQERAKILNEVLDKRSEIGQGIRKHMTLELIEELNKDMVNIRETERDNLNKLPPKVAINLQSGYLLGYADCWNKFYKALDRLKAKNNIKQKG